MQFPNFDTQAAWRAPDMTNDPRWVVQLDDKATTHLAEITQRVFSPDRDFFDYDASEFDLGPADAPLRKAVHEAYFGCGLSLLKGLPRAQLAPDAFKILVWGIGLQLGVARPQGLASHYMSEVRAAGNTYRSAGGRGYNTNSGLDFHADGCDVVGLACFNKAKAGGQSMVSSSVTAWQILVAERPDLADVACETFYFSRNKEQADDEAPYYAQPLVDFADGRLFVKWNRNRVRTAQDLEGVPALTDAQRECADLLDDILRRPEVLFTMWLEPGDLQFMNNHVMLHSRTEFEDFEAEEHKRLLYRLWLAPPDSVRLPDTWGDYFRSVAPGTVRGGIRGQHHDDRCRAFEARQAAYLGMPTP